MGKLVIGIAVTGGVAIGVGGVAFVCKMFPK